MRWLPVWLYEWLPTIYVVVGSLLAAYGPGSIAKTWRYSATVSCASEIKNEPARSTTQTP